MARPVRRSNAHDVQLPFSTSSASTNTALLHTQNDARVTLSSGIEPCWILTSMKHGSERCDSFHSLEEHFPSTAPQAFCTACPAYLGTVSHALLAISMGVSHHSIHQTCSPSSYRHNSPASVTILQQFKMAKLSPSQSKCHASRWKLRHSSNSRASASRLSVTGETPSLQAHTKMERPCMFG
jgi:hypothetical protein